ncbi:non-ribosomal peptide synthetase [Corynebacterium pseudopelargi]|uniref:Enterobactin synthase component F n=1 Tax=Corynebacterium pseudopelargi TaxID=2080757 RepID=A0A3G6IWE5_9CORY|nr:non-ribosomal peptide synthetase [Corynebacterium pseudopelargi]AZA10022.1 Enterobactin synthase component F [Corynebacterium pseudopelargi]
MKRLLNAGQQAHWFINATTPEQCQCAELVILRPTKDAAGTYHSVDSDTLTRAIEHCTREVPEFSASFFTEAQQPVMSIPDQPVTHKVQVLDPRTLEAQGLSDTSTEALARWAHHLVDQAPASTQKISGTGLIHHVVASIPHQAQSHTTVWVMRVHHIVADGFAVNAFIAWVARCYTALIQEQALPPSPFSQASATKDELFSTECAQYWRAQSLPVDPPSLIAHTHGSKRPHSLSAQTHITAETRAALRKIAAASGATELDIACTLIAHYTAAMTHAEHITLGLPMMHRPFGQQTIAMSPVASVLPIALDCPVQAPGIAPKLEESIASVAQQLGQARAHASIRLEDIRRLHGLSDPSRRLLGPSINIRPFTPSYSFAGVKCEIRTLSAGPVVDAEWVLQSAPNGGWDCLLLAHGSTKDQEMIEAHANRMAEFFAQASRLSPTQRLSDISIATETEQQQCIEVFNRTQHVLPWDSTTTLSHLLHQQRAAALHATPDGAAPLLYFAQQELPSDQAWGVITTIANKMHDLGVRSGDMVALGLPRSASLSLSIAAVLLLGAQWVPVDPTLPEARRAYMLERTQPRLLVIPDTDVWDAFDASSVGIKATLRLSSTDIRAGQQPSFEQPAWLADLELPKPEHTAYVLFTSGSTGKPKAVAVPHRGVLNRLVWMVEYYQISREAQACIMQKTPSSFDVSVWELLLPFSHDVPCAILPEQLHLDPVAVAEHINSAGVTHCHFVPSALGAFLNSQRDSDIDLDCLKHVITSGEALDAGLAHATASTFDVQVHNLYGPTEASIDVTAHTVRPEDRVIPIGKPVWNTRTYVLDPWQQAVPVGARGMLYLAGVQLANGYLGQPELTAQQFVEDPFAPAGQENRRMYRTGDLASWRADGSLLYHGRSDGQVKLRGQRLELGEVSATMQHVSGVAQAVAVVHEGSRLLGYAIPSDAHADEQALIHAIRQACTAALPSYMVPSAIILLERFPMTLNGKLDTKALPLPEVEHQGSAELSKDPYTAQVQQAFAEVLNLGVVGTEDNFFDLGGTSLEAIALANALGTKVRVADVFAAPSVDALANALRQLDAEQPSNNAGTARWLSLRAHREGIPVICLYPAGGLGWSYAGLVAQLDPGRGVYACQAPGVDGTSPRPATLAEAAKIAAEDIAQMCTTLGVTDVDVVGWSVGGVLAHEVAACAPSFGFQCRRVLLLDAYPAEAWAALPAPTEIEKLQGIATMAGCDPAVLDTQDPQRARAQLREALSNSGGPFAHLPSEVLAEVSEVVGHNARLMREHRSSYYPGSIDLFQATVAATSKPQGEAEAVRDPQLWEAHTAELRIHPLGISHPEMVHPATLARVAALLA